MLRTQTVVVVIQARQEDQESKCNGHTRACCRKCLPEIHRSRVKGTRWIREIDEVSSIVIVDHRVCGLGMKPLPFLLAKVASSITYLHLFYSMDCRTYGLSHSDLIFSRTHAWHTPLFLLFDKAQAAIHQLVCQWRERYIIGYALLMGGIGATCMCGEWYGIVYEKRQYSINPPRQNQGQILINTYPVTFSNKSDSKAYKWLFSKLLLLGYARCTLNHWAMLSCHT